MLPPVALFLLTINLWTILRFRQDKAFAIAGARRIPEAKLLGLALIGGTPGALLARRIFRHKTRKEPFSTQLLVIAAVQAGALIGAVIV
ncbi:MAG: cold-shock protein [Sphingomonas bacterium]|nr:cold-shock protein [Sphingomonas bacterium]